MQIYVPPGPRLGDVVVQFDGVSKTYGDRLLFEDLSFTVPPGAIVGVIGPNGAGKTTLLRLIAGQEQPDAGKITVGQTVELGYVDRESATLTGDRSVWGEISGGQDTLTLGQHKMNSRACRGVQLPRHGPAEEGGRPVRRRAQPGAPGEGVEGRGERAAAGRADQRPGRQHPARAGRGVDDFGGSALVVSHDRWFLDRICTNIIVLEEDGSVNWFVGNW